MVTDVDCWVWRTFVVVWDCLIILLLLYALFTVWLLIVFCFGFAVCADCLVWCLLRLIVLVIAVDCLFGVVCLVDCLYCEIGLAYTCCFSLVGSCCGCLG